MVNIDRNSTCSFTGHRAIPDGVAEYLLQRIKDGVNYLYSHGVKTYLIGGALGFDTLAAKAVIECRNIHEGYTAYPCYSLPGSDAGLETVGHRNL